ncbi:MAG: OmpA family protein [Bacteroidaceae bacterium]|nr:OmpA family protein [Bacteroidaceae bacterium]
MKKLMMALAFIGLGTAAANAQCDEFATPTTNKYSVATNSFWDNWYVQLGVDAHVIDVYDNGAHLLSGEWHDTRTYGVDVAVGKWFTPGIGTRLKLNWQNGQFPHAFRNQDHVSEYIPSCEAGGYATLYFDTQFNLINMISGYSEDRMWNLSVFPRLGLSRNFDTNNWSPQLGVGLESSWNITKNVAVYADLAYCWATDGLAAYESNSSGMFVGNGIAQIDLGVTIGLGKQGWSKAVSLDDYEALSAEACSKLAALRAQLKAEQDENARLRDLLAKQPTEKIIKETIVTSNAASVFFNLNSSKINSKKDLINIDAVASAAKNSGAKVVVTGSADSKTGSSAYNQKLSESRAQAVADELVKLGVDRSKIEVKGIGGVNDVTPYNLNRRAVIELK